jgi:hypothetical protein
MIPEPLPAARALPEIRRVLAENIARRPNAR